MKEIPHGFHRSAPETKSRQTDGGPDGHPRRRQYPPPQPRRAWNKNDRSRFPRDPFLVTDIIQPMSQKSCKLYACGVN